MTIGNGHDRRASDSSALNKLAESAVTRLASRAALLTVGAIIAWVGIRMVGTFDDVAKDAAELSKNVAVITSRLNDHDRRLGYLERSDRRAKRDADDGFQGQRQ